MATAAPPIPRIELAYAPTPLLKLERLSAEIGVELWVKRDDLTGLLESGNKVRKLEFVLGEAMVQQADTLVTCGAAQSNGCRTVAAVAARLGLKAVLALPGPPPAEYDGNLLLGKLLGAELRFCTEAEWEKRDELLQELAGRARVAGRTPFVIPEGAATVAGALGYFVCGQEIAQQVRHGAPEFDTIVITAFTGGSLAGLLMARQLTGLRSEVAGVAVAGDADNVRACVMDVITQAARRYGLPVQPPPAVRLLEGCGEVGRGELETVLRLARLEGLMLDPADTARAFGGLLERLRREPGSLGRRVCFVHTGGVFGVFPFRDRLGALADTSLW